MPSTNYRKRDYPKMITCEITLRFRKNLSFASTVCVSIKYYNRRL